MSKERELLKRALEELDGQDAALRQEFEGFSGWEPLAIIEEIRNYLAEPEVKREPLSEFGVTDLYYSGIVHEDCYLAAFAKGFRMAEKHHGIGVEDE